MRPYKRPSAPNTTEPSICWATMPGLTTVPQSSAQTTRCTRGWPPPWTPRPPAPRWCRTTRAAQCPGPAPPAGACPAGLLGAARSSTARWRGACFSNPRRKLDRILPASRRQLVDEGLRKEGVVRMADGPPEPDGHARVRVATCSIFWWQRNRAGRTGLPTSSCPASRRDPPALGMAALHPARRDGVACGLDGKRWPPGPCRRWPPQLRDMHRTVEVVRGVFLARPQQLHRHAGHPSRPARPARRSPPPAGARSHRPAASHARRRSRPAHPRLARPCRGHLRHLGRRPDFDLAVADLAVQFIGSSVACAR
jgi:hypothetical protein